MDKNYWSNVLKARKEIYNLITDFGISSVRSNADVNPLFSQITNNGGIGLEFYYGIPLYLYTPLGRIEIAGDFTIVRNEDAILERLIADYGAVLITRSIISSLFLYSSTEVPKIILAMIQRRSFISRSRENNLVSMSIVWRGALLKDIIFFTVLLPHFYSKK